MSKGQTQVLYGLYGVVEHSGRLNSGHYVAYVRSRPLDPSRTNKQYLNLKPSSQFEIDQLVAEMAEKIDASCGTLRSDLKGPSGNKNSVNVEVRIFLLFSSLPLLCNIVRYYKFDFSLMLLLVPIMKPL